MYIHFGLERMVEYIVIEMILLVPMVLPFVVLKIRRDKKADLITQTRFQN